MKKANNIEILYEDNHIIVVNKPINILSQADNTNDVDMLTLVKKYIKEKYDRPGNVYLGLVHRLDRPTSGIMVFAKTSKAAARLCDSIRKKEVTKRYYAVLNGILDYEESLTDYIEKDEKNNSIITTSDKGKYAELNYKILKKDIIDNLSLLDIELITGRHHQIRIQFASRGYSLYGDNRYGKQDKKQLCLHAYYLSFVHPTTKEILEFKNIPNIDGGWVFFADFFK